MNYRIIFLSAFMAFPCLSEKYIVQPSNSTFGKYSNYPDVIINEICIHQVGYLVTDNGYIIVAVDQNNRPLICKETKNPKGK